MPDKAWEVRSSLGTIGLRIYYLDDNCGELLNLTPGAVDELIDALRQAVAYSRPFVAIRQKCDVAGIKSPDAEEPAGEATP